MGQLFALVLYFAVFVAWVNGVAVCLQAHEYFWAVFNFAFFPAGVIVGAFNFFF